MFDGIFNWDTDFVKVFERWSIWIAIIGAFLISGIKIAKKAKNSWYDDGFIQLHGEIHELLTELRVLTDSARTQIIQFHNGEYFMDGISMRKFSLTHESVEKGIESDGQRVQGYLCSMFLPLFQLLLENNPKVRYVVDLKESYVKQYLEARNVEAFSLLPIKISNQITGFVLIQWCNALKVEKIDESYVIHEFKKITDSITVQLSLQRK